MTSDDEIHDALLAALRSPARPDELAGEDVAVAAMLGALRTTAPARRGSRSRRGAAAAVVTMASLGVGGLVAAGPGFFGDVRDTLHDTFVPGGDDGPEDGTVPTPGTTRGSQPGGTTVAVPGAGTTPDGTDPDSDVSVVPGTTGTGDDCNHGETVSSVAQGGTPGSDHGDAVSGVAHDGCSGGGDGGPPATNPGNGNGGPPASNPGNGDGNGNGNGTPPSSQPGSGNATGGGVGNRPDQPGPPATTPGDGKGGNGNGGNGGGGDAPTDPGSPATNPGNAGGDGKPNG